MNKIYIIVSLKLMVKFHEITVHFRYIIVKDQNQKKYELHLLSKIIELVRIILCKYLES